MSGLFSAGTSSLILVCTGISDHIIEYAFLVEISVASMSGYYEP